MRVPLLSGSRLVVATAEDPVVLAPPPPPDRTIADVGAAVRDALRFPLAGPPLESIVTRGGRVDHPRRTAGVADPRDGPRPAAGGDRRRLRASSNGSASRRSGRRSSSLRGSPAGRDDAASRASSPATSRCASAARSPCTTSRIRPRHRRRARRCPAPRPPGPGRDRRRSSPSAPPRRSCTAARVAARGSGGAETQRPPRPTRCSRPISAPGLGPRAVALERALGARVPLIGASLTLDLPRLSGALRGYPYEPAGRRPRRSARGSRAPSDSLPGAAAHAHARVAAARAHRLGGVRRARRRSRTPRRSSAASRPSRRRSTSRSTRSASASRGRRPLLPRERPNALAAADARPRLRASALAGRLPGAGRRHRDPRRAAPPPLRPSDPAAVPRRSSRRRARAATRPTSPRRSAPPATDPRAIEAYRSGRTCHPRLPFADWDACRPALDRLGAVLVAGLPRRDRGPPARLRAHARDRGGVRDGPRPRRRGHPRRRSCSLRPTSRSGSARAGGWTTVCPSAPGSPVDQAVGVAHSSPRYVLRTCSFSRSAFASSASAIRARLEHVATVGDVERHQGVLLDEQDRRALLVDLDDDLEDLLDEDRREPHRRLVEQEQVRLRHQRPPDRAHLLLAAGHRPRLLRLALGETREEREHAVEVVLQPALSFRWNAPISRFSSTVIRGKSFRPSGRLGDAARDDVVRSRVR